VNSPSARLDLNLRRASNRRKHSRAGSGEDVVETDFLPQALPDFLVQ
jgi:hypothetical protein